MAYWISIMYLEGAVLWIVGAAYTMSSLSERGMLYERALVWVPPFSASICPRRNSIDSQQQFFNASEGVVLQQLVPKLKTNHKMSPKCRMELKIILASQEKIKNIFLGTNSL